MEKYRKPFFELLQKFHASAQKQGAPEHKMAVALKKIVDQHVRKLPADRALASLFLEMGTVRFCAHVLEQLAQNMFISFAPLKAPPKPRKPSKPKSKSIGTMDANDAEEEMPTDKELQAHYISVFDSLQTRYGPSFTCPPDLFKAYTPSENRVFPTPHVYGLLAMVFREETHPPLFSLLDRLERLFSESMVAYLPLQELVDFFTQKWDGSETALLHWERYNYHRPLKTADKKTLQHWAILERCPILATFTSVDMEEFLRIASHPMYRRMKMNAPQILSGMDLGKRRKMIPLGSCRQTPTPVAQYFAFWDLSWLPEKVIRRTIVPMDAGTVSLSEKTFAAHYFTSTYTDKEVMKWAGKIPFRIEYVRVDGSRWVQTEEMFRTHQRVHREKGWEVAMHHLPDKVRETFKTMVSWWITSALKHILSTDHYDIPLLARRILCPIFKKSTLGKMMDQTYKIVGRLHPFFPLSRHHGVLVERIRHLYFVPEFLSRLPKLLLFPEYFASKDHHRVVLDAQWEAHRQIFQSCLLEQWSRDSVHAVPFSPSNLPGMPFPKKLDRNIHFHENGTRTTLENVMENWENLFYDEAMVPHGLPTLGLLVQAPDYYRGATTSDHSLGLFLDGFLTVPSYHPYPVYPPATDNVSDKDEDEDEDTVSDKDSDKDESEDDETFIRNQ
jgi:hypothetical protein